MAFLHHDDSDKSKTEQVEHRLFIPRPEGWSAEIKQNWDKEYCFRKREGEDYFHLLLAGEILIRHGDEVFCLECAHAMGILTTDRTYWQKGPSSTS